MIERIFEAQKQRNKELKEEYFKEKATKWNLNEMFFDEPEPKKVHEKPYNPRVRND